MCSCQLGHFHLLFSHGHPKDDKKEKAKQVKRSHLAFSDMCTSSNVSNPGICNDSDKGFCSFLFSQSGYFESKAWVTGGIQLRNTWIIVVIQMGFSRKKNLIILMAIAITVYNSLLPAFLPPHCNNLETRQVHNLCKRNMEERF
jgi:hypothetical protein